MSRVLGLRAFVILGEEEPCQIKSNRKATHNPGIQEVFSKLDSLDPSLRWDDKVLKFILRLLGASRMEK